MNALRMILKGCFLAACLTSPLASAGGFSTANLQLLTGSDYQLGNPSRQIVTAQVANVWAYGDNFVFFDVTDPDGPDTHVYAEWSPRLSLSALTGAELNFGPVADILLAGNFEWGEQLNTRLFGLGARLQVPGFQMLQANAYWRDREQLAGTSWQVTVAWLSQWSWSGVDWQFTGFVDWAGPEGGMVAHQLSQPQLLVDLSSLWGAQHQLWLGLEYQYWHNKFGIKGVTERVPQAMLKWVLF